MLEGFEASQRNHAFNQRGFNAPYAAKFKLRLGSAAGCSECRFIQGVAGDLARENFQPPFEFWA